MAKYDKADLERRMHGAVESLKSDLAGLRTGRAHTALLELLVEDLAGNWSACDPQPGNQQEREKQESEQPNGEDPLPSALADDNRLPAVLVFAPPRRHGL